VNDFLAETSEEEGEEAWLPDTDFGIPENLPKLLNDIFITKFITQINI